MTSTQSVGQLQPAQHTQCIIFSRTLSSSINHFPCIPDQQPGTPRAAGSVWLCEQPAVMLEEKYHGSLPSGGSQESTLSSHTVNLGQYSQFRAFLLYPHSFFEFQSGISLPPTSPGSPGFILNTQVHALCSQGNVAASSLHSSNVFPE